MRHDAMFWEESGEGRVRCNLCSHRCSVAEGSFGFCGVRRNEGGVLRTFTYGEVVSANVDPIEKKPLYHVLPGSQAYSVATPGCNFKCDFCQNWRISQLSYREGNLGGKPMSPERIVEDAARRGCASIAYTYTEPTIFFEYAYDTSRLASQNGLRNVFVTNGYMTPEVLETAAPVLDACNVDLKSFSDSLYRQSCRGRLEPVLEAIRTMKRLGIWIEITTLVIPGRNDSEEELRSIAEFIAGVDPSIPWHVSAFRPEYRVQDIPATPVATLETALDIGAKAGLVHVYPGNVALPGDTKCAHCGETVVSRGGFGGKSSVTVEGTCPSCGSRVAGVWS